MDVCRASLHQLATEPKYTLSVDITEQDALQEMCLTPDITKIHDYQAKLAKKSRSACVPTQRTIPLVLTSTRNIPYAVRTYAFIAYKHYLNFVSKLTYYTRITN